jgi:hypothetical protein
MPAGKTYTPIARTTLSSAAASVTFSSISGSYTDLILVSNLGGSVSGEAVRIQINSDSGSNYSYTAMRGNGTSATSERATSATSLRISTGVGVTTNTSDMTIITNLQNYSNTTTFKTLISRAGQAANGTESSVGLWRSTSAINAIQVSNTNGNIVAGSTFTLYGILAA